MPIRRPHNINEKRAVEAVLHDDDMQLFGIHIRAKRSVRLLPDDRNDTFASTYDDNSWKRHRQVQYYRHIPNLTVSESWPLAWTKETGSWRWLEPLIDMDLEVLLCS